MRVKTNMAGLVSHAVPGGKASYGTQEKVLRDFHRGDITSSEVKEHAHMLFMNVSKRRNSSSSLVKVPIGGKYVVVPRKIAELALYRYEEL